MEKNKNNYRFRITLLLGFIFLIIFSISAASALDNTYYWTPSSGAIGSSGYTANWGSCGQSPATYRITTLSSTGFICNSDYLTTTSAGDQFLAIYPTAYSSDMTITGKTGATFYLSGQGRTATYRFDLGYAKNGAFTSLGYVTRSASTTGSLYTIDMSSITGTAPAGSYLALKVSVTSSRGGRIYLGTNGGVTGSNSGRFYVSENPTIPPTPSYNVTVTATPTSSDIIVGNNYTYNIIVNNIGNTKGNYTLNVVDSDTVNFQSSILGTTSIQINSGGSTNTTLTVSAKTTGTIGAIDITNVIVSSVENPIYTNSTQVSTTIINTPPPSPTDYKIIVSSDRYSIFSPWMGKASDTSLSANFTAYALLLDNNGKPVSGQGITFKIYSGDGTVKATKTSIAQANGLASVPYDTYSDFTGSADADYGTWKIEAYMTNSPTIISSANMKIQAGGNTLSGGCKANCHSTNIGTGGKPQSPYTDSYGQTSSREVAAHKKVSHQSNGCYLCHTGYSEIKTGTYGNTSDVHKNMTCDNCHGTWASFGSSSGTGIPRMPSCYDCHPVSNSNVSIISTLANLAAGNGISVYSYNFDLKKPLAAHNGTMYSLVDSVPCIACHGPAHNVSKPYMTSKNNVTENEQCWACHTNRATTHKSNTNCVGCHTQDAHNISIGGGGSLQPATYIPADPTNLQNTTSNFWINHMWLPGIGNTTNSYNVSVNGTWYNGTINTFENTTTVPHGWVNITVWAYNSSGTGALSAGSVSQNTQILNNLPVQASIGSKTVNEGQWLNFTVSATDLDNDTIAYGTNATKGTFNTTTGQFSWTPGYGDAGVYVWYFNSSDSYGGVTSETITVTVNNTPLSVTLFSPPSDPTTTQGTAQTFNVTLNRTANVTWYMNGTQVQTDTGTTSASYTNSTAAAGTWNVTASATDSIDTISRTWNWTVNPQPPANYIPPTPINLQNRSGNFWVNHTWLVGAGNVTNSYNASVNGTWYNGTINTFKNTTTVPHGWVNIIVWAYNSSGTGSLSAGSVSQNTQVPNNPPAQAQIGNMDITAGDLLTFTVSATDADNDTITYGTNATKGTLNATTGVYSWQTTSSDAGAHVWYFNSSDSYGGVASETITVTVTVAPPSKYVPPIPANLISTQGNFWINNSWQAGAGNATDSYNVSVNGSWMNGTTSTYYNDTVGPHGWSNITVWAYNNSDGGSLSSAPVSQSMQVANNAPLQTAIGNKSVDEGDLLAFTVSATDIDNDTITYGTNATKGSFNTTTGNFSWTPSYGDAGIYTWSFNSSDGYGGIASETITVTVNNVPLSITSSSPIGDPATMAGTARTFGIVLNRTASATWYIDGSAVQTDSSIASANYTNSTATAGTYNVTVAATDGYDSVSKQWNWIVNSQPVYAPGITSWSNNKNNNNSLTLAVNTSEPVNFNATANQTIITWNWYQDNVNQNNNYDNLTTSWNTSGTKSIQVNATNSNGTSNTITWTVIVLAQPAIYTSPPPANITSTTGNFWVNTAWLAGAGNVTDSYNVSVNGAWTNGTTNTSVNSSLSAHSWQNVTVYAYNASGGGSLSASPATKNTQIPNNPLVQGLIGNKTVNEGQWLNFTVHATDVDNDIITYGTNVTKGSFNAATGNFSWPTTYSDSGVYVWYFNSSDGYGGVTSETIIVTVNNTPLSVTSFSPLSDPTTTQGTAQTFNITLNRTANVIWYMNGVQVQTNTGVVSAVYTNSTAGVGAWNMTANATDGTDTVSRTWNWTVNPQPPSAYIPPNPTNLQNTTGNFWINHMWLPGAGNTTDSYNVSVNGTWYNGTTDAFKNSTTAPHGWVNIIVWAYSSSGTGSLSPGSISQDTQVANNPPSQDPIGNKAVDEGQLLTFKVNATDADNDTITYGANATKGVFNTTTGNFSWVPAYGDAGIYTWYFNSSDGYGGVASETVTVTVNNVPLSITSSVPASDPTTTAGTLQTFEITLNRTANISWYIDGSAAQTNSSVASADYTNSTAGAGIYNVTAIADDGYDSASKQWNWTVVLQPVYVPGIISWSNSKTNNDSLTLAVNTSEPVNFNAIANQTITAWNWYQDGVNQVNNYDNLTTSWNTSGTKSIQVNATNSNGTSNTITWTVLIAGSADKGPNCLDCHRSAE
jgi:hypothetical protein